MSLALAYAVVMYLVGCFTTGYILGNLVGKLVGYLMENI